MSKKLENLLKVWAETKAPGKDRIQNLSENISQTISEASTSTGFESKPVRLEYLPKYLVAACAIAVISIVAVLVSFLNTGSKQLIKADCPALIMQSEVEQLTLRARLLFKELDYLFADNFRWAAFSNDEVKLGVDSFHGANDSCEIALQYRLAVFARSRGEDRWKMTGFQEVLLRPQELVNLEVTSGGFKNLSLWVMPVNENKLMVETDWTADLPVPITASWTALLNSGEAEEIYSTRSGDIEYRVYHTAVLFKKYS